MEVKAKLNYLRIAPRKTRLVADLVRGKTVEEAQTILNFTVKRGNTPIVKLLNTAIASAKENFQVDKSNLYIAKIFIDEAPMLKRWRARSRGRAYGIKKRASHITLVLGEIKKGGVKTKKIKKSKSLAESKENQSVVKAKKKDKFLTPQKHEAKFSKQTSSKGTNKIFRRKSI